jgi:predicted RNA-binding Zn-ribbon protein involved in translation (DUF1610 family)
MAFAICRNSSCGYSEKIDAGAFTEICPECGDTLAGKCPQCRKDIEGPFETYCRKCSALIKSSHGPEGGDRG